jgi:chromosome segregation ATPase
MGVQQVVDVLTIANNNLPAIEERFKRLRNDVSMLQSQKHTCKRNLYQLNNQIATTSRLLNSLRMSCERERREIVPGPLPKLSYQPDLMGENLSTNCIAI